MSEHGQESHGHAGPTSHGGLIAVAIIIVLLLIGYGVLVSKGLPQDWTKQSNSAHHGDHDDHADEHAEHADHDHAEPAEPSTEEAPPAEDQPQEKAEEAAPAPADADAEHGAAKAHGIPPYWMITPFALLLLCIAVLPLIPATEHWWESNLNRFIVAATLGAVTLAYYYFMCDFPVELHWPGHKIVDPADPEGGRFAVMSAIFINAIIVEFIPFIVLLFSLFCISGGIRIQGDLKASPFTNSVILLIGATLASFVGTTGAAMLLIRLLLETNQQRKYKVHTVVFFIFCVCNCGGCLLPIGDPPLFLGYLRGVDFLWTFQLWKEWAFVNGCLIVIYFLLDTIWFYRKESKADLAKDNTETQPMKISGLALNLPLLIGVVLSVMFLDPSKTIPGTDWHPWYFLREMVQLFLVAVSLGLGSYTIRKGNSFTFAAIVEVAALFFGIFICMQAPLQILNEKGKSIGLETSHQFYWATGSLSAVLDNAPTYVVFFETARTLSPNTEEELKADPEWGPKYEAGEMVAVNGGFIDEHLLVAISLGAVFMGAMTYIGNGPNFMVKAVAESSGVKMPSFFGYMAYSCCILLPVFVVMTLIFL